MVNNLIKIDKNIYYLSLNNIYLLNGFIKQTDNIKTSIIR